jgi:hypothetical protein
LEQQSQRGVIDLYYGDESQVSEVGYVPYAWQFNDERVHVSAGRGRSMNYFGLLSRSNEFVYRASEAAITSSFVLEQLDRFSLGLVKLTVVVLEAMPVFTRPNRSKSGSRCGKSGVSTCSTCRRIRRI